MAPGGPWLSPPAIFTPNGDTATHLVTFLIFGVISAQKHVVSVLKRHRRGWLQVSLCGNYTVSLSGNHTVSLCGNHTVSLCGNHTELCGQAPGGRRAVAPTLTPLVFNALFLMNIYPPLPSLVL